MRRTKIVATVGPSSASPAVLADLVGAGVDVFRLNFSHGTHESHAEAFARIREAALGRKRHVGIMQDLSGPKIRTGPIAGGGTIELADGAPLRLEIGDGDGIAGRVFVTYAPLAAAVKAGDRLLLDDGRIELRVEHADPAGIDTTVVDGGSLGGRKGIAAPGVPLPASALTEKDVADLEFGLALGVDLVALSFVQTADDIKHAREIMRRAGRTASIIPKIERPLAVDNIDAILAESDGVMVARGDLGLELPFERVPTVQKQITRRARARGIPIIVATQVLESMREEARPTRAEVSDAANAVDDGVDAIMLAGETAAGLYPIKAVQALDAIVREAERLPPAGAPAIEPTFDPTRTGHGRALCEAAVTLARRSQADAIVAVTRQGYTARMLSALRPAAPIYAATPSPSVAKRLALQWGVAPFVCTNAKGEEVERELVDCGAIARGTVIVFVSISADLHREHSNFLRLRRIG